MFETGKILFLKLPTKCLLPFSVRCSLFYISETQRNLHFKHIIHLFIYFFTTYSFLHINDIKIFDAYYNLRLVNILKEILIYICILKTYLITMYLNELNIMLNYYQMCKIYLFCILLTNYYCRNNLKLFVELKIKYTFL